MLKRLWASVALAFMLVAMPMVGQAATRITMPPTSLPAGQGSQKTVANIPDTDNLATVTINKVSWPGAGDAAGWFQISYYIPGDSNPHILMRADFLDAPADGSQLVFTASIPRITGRKVQIDWNFFKPLTVSGTLDTSQVNLAH
jgi:hypothetical protein